MLHLSILYEKPLTQIDSPVSGGEICRSMMVQPRISKTAAVWRGVTNLLENPCESVKSVAEVSGFPVKTGRAH
jgi:hypothetical protein